MNTSLLPLILPAGHETDSVVVAVSGGKDSTALSLAIKESGVEARYAFADTGWEAPETYEHIDRLERVLGTAIHRVQGVKGGFRALVLASRTFPRPGGGRLCTRMLKIDPLNAYAAAVGEETESDTLMTTGVRGEESRSRSTLSAVDCVDAATGLYVWRPILTWTVNDVLAMHHRHGVAVNPLYRAGFDRVGCYPCCMVPKRELQLVARRSPARIAEIAELERNLAGLRTVQDQTTIRPSGGGSTMFRQSIAGKFRHLPIAEILEATAELEGADPEGGCFRWGYCEPPST